MPEETIAAISTAPGAGGIGIVRISGARAEEILARVFLGGGTGACGVPGGHAAFPDRVMRYGFVRDPLSNETIDEALAVLMRAPHSYTGEDVAEIQCHGGIVPLRRILGLVLSQGASLAEAGEFTKRAFLNGRIDLVQAESVVDLIYAETARGFSAAREQADGKLSSPVYAAREILLGLLAETEARIDYPEAFEDLTQFAEQIDGRSHARIPEISDFVESTAEDLTQNDAQLRGIRQAREIVDRLLENADAGRFVRNGIRVALLGKPNTGKSSLFNALAREAAAIVTEIPGTTRDALEIRIDLEGFPVILTDTAGIRETDGLVETLGIERSKTAYERADVAVLLIDASLPLSAEDSLIAQMLLPEKPLVVALNKQDLPVLTDEAAVRRLVPFAKRFVKTRLLFGEGGFPESSDILPDGGIAALEAALLEAALSRNGAFAGAGQEFLVTRERHRNLLETASAELSEAQSVLAAGDAPEFAEVNLRAAYDALGEIVGAVYTDDILDRIFSEFCIGK